MSARRADDQARINGVSVAALLDKVDAIKILGDKARYRFRVRNQWLDGGHTRSTVKDFYGAGAERTSRACPFVAESDTPALFSGGERAMDPLELLLVALASSVTTTVVWHAAARGIHVDGIETQAEGDIDLRGCLGLDRAFRAGYTAIRLSVWLDAEASDAELDKLLRLGTRYSPVFDTICRSTPVTVLGMLGSDQVKSMI